MEGVQEAKEDKQYEENEKEEEQQKEQIHMSEGRSKRKHKRKTRRRKGGVGRGGNTIGRKLGIGRETQLTKMRKRKNERKENEEK